MIEQVNSENQETPQRGSKIPKEVFIIALLMLAVGIAAGAFIRYKNFNILPIDNSILGSTEEELVVEKALQELETRQEFQGGTDTEVKQSEVNIETKSTPPAPPPIPPPSRPAPKPAANICETTGKERDQKLAQIEKEYTQETAAAKEMLDKGLAKNSSLLSALSRQRNDAVNNYLTAIALATSKYNSSTATSSYPVYQQEQATALNAYTEAITKISAEEGPMATADIEAQKQYDVAVRAAADKRAASMAQAQTEYEAKTAGKQCAN